MSSVSDALTTLPCLHCGAPCVPNGVCERCGRRDGDEPPARAPTVLPAPAAPSMDSGLFPGYVVLRRVGAGRMGEVFQAHPEGYPSDLRALKTPHGELLLGGPEVVARFRREAIAIQRVHHPGVVRVYEIAQTGDGRPFLSMEWLEGRSLAEAVDDPTSPFGDPADPALPGLCVRLAEELASALEASHAQGVIHRDIKPSNVVLCDESPEGMRAVLIDFGIARLEDVGAFGGTAALAVGTAENLAPEVARGDPVGPWTDTYLLAQLLYRVLSGVRRSTGLPKRLSRVNPALPAALDAVIEDGLADDPEDRPSSPMALAEGVRGALEAEERLAKAAAQGRPAAEASPLSSAGAAASAAAARPVTPVLASSTNPGSPTAPPAARHPLTVAPPSERRPPSGAGRVTELPGDPPPSAPAARIPRPAPSEPGARPRTERSWSRPVLAVGGLALLLLLAIALFSAGSREGTAGSPFPVGLFGGSVFPASGGSPELIFATGGHVAPMYDTRSDPPTGYDIELVRELAARLGKRSATPLPPGGRLLDAVAAGKADLGIGAISITPDRERTHLFSAPYLEPEVHLIIPARLWGGLPVDLSSVRCAPAHAIYGPMVQRAGCREVSAGSPAKARRLTNEGQADAMAFDLIEANTLSDEWRDSGKAIGLDHFAIAFRRGNVELKARVDAALVEMRRDGWFEAINERYGSVFVDSSPQVDSIAAARKGRPVDPAFLATDCDLLWQTRNWVFARHGFTFPPGRAADFFDAQEGYWARFGVDERSVGDLLTPTDGWNRDVVLARERELGCR